ncbi:MAG: 3-oxoacyl-ACP reductase FabG [Defluviicoccus sp.]|nr:3-oxoacyl-ACP reductase FabG [Defluviicoccus sp.]
MGKLEGKVALITGASRGLGKAMAIAFAGEGAAVAVGYNTSAEGAADTVRTIRDAGGVAEAFQGDITQPEIVDRLVSDAVDRFGGIDILVNNAGIVSASPLVDMSIEAWDTLFAVHVRAMFLCCRAVLPHMLEKGSGKIINMGGTFGMTGMENFTHLSAAKAAMIGFTRALAKEVGPQGIRVNCLTPAMIRGETTANLPQDYLESLRQRYPLRRLGEVEDVNACALFLASDESDFVTGQNLAPAGGEVMP